MRDRAAPREHAGDDDRRDHDAAAVLAVTSPIDSPGPPSAASASEPKASQGVVGGDGGARDWEKVFPVMQHLHAYWYQSKWSYRTLLFSALLASVSVPFGMMRSGAAEVLAKLAKSHGLEPKVVFWVWSFACFLMLVAVLMSGPFTLSPHNRAENHLKQAAEHVRSGRWKEASQSALLAGEAEQQELTRMRKSSPLVMISLILFLVCAGTAFWATLFLTE